MAKNRRYKDNRQNRDKGQFALIPFVVMDSPGFIGLSSAANKLLIDLVRQYNGGNNGYLCCCFSLMQKRGWKSKETLQKAKVELIKAGILVETRKGGRPNRASYYGLTWLACNEQNGKTPLDINPQQFPRSLYLHPERYVNYLLSTDIVPVEGR